MEKIRKNYKVLLKHNEIQNAFNLRADSAIQQALNEQDPIVLLTFLPD